MVVRREKKTRKLRGSRYMGYGVRQHRGSGQKGGVGKAGLHKHKWSYVLKYDRDYFGKHGFKPPKSEKEEDIPINLWELELLIDKLCKNGVKMEEEGGKIVIDITKFGYSKVLGEGKITKPIIVKAKKFSENAVKKIKEAGGEIIKI
ncbi:MAG: uL15 family ribosomal protein [Candidatus Methanomethylicia archaeon]